MRGFTLLETLIYIALLALLITGALMGTYNLVQSTSRTTTSSIAQDEGSFVRRKLEWALMGMTSAPTVGGSGCNGTLSVSKPGVGNPIRFQLSSGAIQMCESASCSTYVPITTDNVSATCFSVTAIPATGTGPSGVSITATLLQKTGSKNPKSYDFTVTRYLRQ